MKSVSQKIMQLEGLTGGKDITAWEESFIESIGVQTGGGKNTGLSDKQVETIDRIWGKHFA